MKKSRFQINDNYIISVGILRGEDALAATEVVKEDASEPVAEVTAEATKKPVRKITRKPAMMTAATAVGAADEPVQA